jgi:hypothetical protein
MKRTVLPRPSEFEEVITMTTLERSHASDVMELLRQGIPLTLLLDLADPCGPRSEELLLLEKEDQAA